MRTLRIIFIAILLLLTFELAIRSGRFNLSSYDLSKTSYKFLNLFEIERLIKIPDKKYEHVVIGTSLVKSIQFPEENDILGFGFIAQSIHSTINFYKSLNHRPKTIFIETNAIAKKEESLFYNQYANPIRLFFLKNFEFCSISRRPISIIAEKIIWRMNSITKSDFVLGNKLDRKTNNNKTQMMLDTSKIRKFMQPMFTGHNELDLYIHKLMDNVHHFEINGAKVVFVEFPMEPYLLNNPYFAEYRKAITTHFPNHDFIRFEDWNQFKTVDGVHLDSTGRAVSESIIRYTQTNAY